MANALYDLGRQAFLEGSISWISDTINVALVSDAYTPSLSTDQYVSDIGSNRVGTDQTLSGKTSTFGVADASDVVFTSVIGGFNIKYILIYKSFGGTNTSPLIALLDTAGGLPISTSGSDITISWDTSANKIFKL